VTLLLESKTPMPAPARLPNTSRREIDRFTEIDSFQLAT
jgi:hypothetical protein